MAANSLGLGRIFALIGFYFSFTSLFFRQIDVAILITF